MTVPSGKPSNLQWRIHHDEDADIYIDGTLATQLSGYTSDYDEVPITPAAKQILKPGKHTLAVHCKQSSNGQFIDLGLIDLLPGDGLAATDTK